ncbi:hypothetical protein DFP72DRAFT_1068357 [Ephemerocybe angulata]|uniref:Uncharacterized protein n=1 Tax=Ephemerocybe angulata TaxID=980116 RepID=A0A8H6HZR7_9AGAR|nr:hypothetical protein DFP72DRAFT_1068357 [Tulosesus angulatus]
MPRAWTTEHQREFVTQKINDYAMINQTHQPTVRAFWSRLLEEWDQQWPPVNELVRDGTLPVRALEQGYVRSTQEDEAVQSYQQSKKLKIRTLFRYIKIKLGL